MTNLQLFYNLLNYYRTGDESYLVSISTSTKDSLVSLANDSYNAILAFIEKSIILPTFFNDDTKHIYEALVEIFAAIRVINILRKSITNPFIIPGQAIKDYLISYGFDIYYLFDETTQRAILGELFSIYKKTGTIEGIATLVKLLGFPEIHIFEHFVSRNSSGDLYLKPYQVYGDKVGIGPVLQLTDPLITSDPLWRLTPQDIDALEAASKFKLPSKTPYFSLVAQYNLLETDIKLSSILMSLVQSELEEFEQTNKIEEKTFAPSFYDKNISFTEAILAYTWLTEQHYPDGMTFDPDVIPEKVLIASEPKYTHDGSVSYYYSDSTNIKFDNPTGIDPYPVYDERNLKYDDVRKLAYVPVITTRDDIVPTILTDYKNIVDGIFSAPYSERQTKINEYLETFVKKGFYTIVDNKKVKVEDKLRELNKDFYEFIADTITKGTSRSYMINLLKDLQQYISYITNSRLTTGIDFDKEKVRQVANFIKPYRARPLIIDSLFVIKDPLDTLIIKDKLRLTGFMRIFCGYQYDMNTRYDKWLFDSGSLKEKIRHDTIYGFDGLPYSIRFDDVDRIAASFLGFDKHFYFDQMKTYDLKRRNSNLCNLFEFSDVVKSISYISLKINKYTPQQYLDKNPYEFDILDKIVNDLQERELQLQIAYQAALDYYDNALDDEKEIAEKTLEVVREKLNLVTHQLEYYSSLPKRRIEPNTVPGIETNDLFNFTDTVYQTKTIPAQYDTECRFDVPGFDTYDLDTYIVREAI